MNQFVWGACAIASATIALFFLRFWRQTKDRLFGLFSMAFLALATNWTILGLLDPDSESRNSAFLFRLLSFSLIVAAIVDKNRRGRRAR